MIKYFKKIYKFYKDSKGIFNDWYVYGYTLGKDEHCLWVGENYFQSISDCSENSYLHNYSFLEKILLYREAKKKQMIGNIGPRYRIDKNIAKNIDKITFYDKYPTAHDIIVSIVGCTANATSHLPSSKYPNPKSPPVVFYTICTNKDTFYSLNRARDICEYLIKGIGGRFYLCGSELFIEDTYYKYYEPVYNSILIKKEYK